MVRASFKLGETKIAVHSPVLPSSNFISGITFAVMFRGSASFDHLNASLYISQNAVLAVTGPVGAAASGLASGAASVFGASEHAVNSRKAAAVAPAAPNRRVFMCATLISDLE